MIVGSKIIYYVINKFYIFTMFIILGFIIGTIPSLIRKTKYSKKNIMISIISFLCTFALNFLKFNLDINILTTIFLGITESFTSIVPGISGTVIFINLGVYEYILKGISTINFSFLIPYLFGILIGIIVFSKMINLLIEMYSDEFPSIINGLVIASLFPIIKNSFNGDIDQIILGLILFIFSSFISYLNT